VLRVLHLYTLISVFFSEYDAVGFLQRARCNRLPS
jgi:hypothetical protein